MILHEPFPRSKISQGFAQNATAFYKENNLTGHPSIDYAVPCGTPIPNLVEGAFCYSVMNKDNANLDRYRAVFTLVEDKNYVYEISYGHLDKIHAIPGTYLKLGESIGTTGNTGDVYMGDLKITNDLRKKIPCAGGHLHGPQVRKCKKVSKQSKGKTYLSNANGIYKWNGSYIEVVDYNNGVNGCVDPMKFYNGKLAVQEEYLPYEIALANLRKGGLPPKVLAMAEGVLKKKYGRI